MTDAILPERRRIATRDWRTRIDASDLPGGARATIADVVRRTRLWRSEKAAVADELIAHFADALAAGTSAEEAVAAFGDPRAAARLIRHAKVRGRPIAWHALKYLTRAVLVLLALYGALIVRFVTARPTIRTDYLAQLNAPTERLRDPDRAWPMYRRVLDDERLNIRPWTDPTLRTPIARQPPGDTYVHSVADATPADPEWPRLGAWLDARAEPIAAIRAAAARPAMGFTYELFRGFTGDAAGRIDARLDWDTRPRPDAPNVNDLSQLRQVLALDFAWARDRGQGRRAADDLVASLDLAAQLRGGPPFLQQDAVREDRETLRRLLDTMRDAPATFDDAQLVALAHRVARIGGDVAASFYDLDVEAMIARDRVQRIYTDDGDGDGRLARAAVRAGWTRDDATRRNEERAGILLGAVASAHSSRRDAEAAIDRAVADARARLARPARELRSSEAWRRLPHDPPPEAGPSPWTIAVRLMRRWPEFIEPRIDAVELQVRAERLMAERDAATVAIGLELYRRRHGTYPPTLDALVAQVLPRGPADRISGDPLRYRVIDGAPVVYSVGIDGDDDGGRAPLDGDGQPWPDAAARWHWASAKPVIDGDWNLFDGRPAAGRR